MDQCSRGVMATANYAVNGGLLNVEPDNACTALHGRIWADYGKAIAGNAGSGGMTMH